MALRNIGNIESEMNRLALSSQPISSKMLVDDTISVHNIKSFLSLNKGKVRHSELVTFFKRPLMDSTWKVRNRNDFKDILSKIAFFKMENGERYVSLKCSSSKDCSQLEQSSQGHIRKPGGIKPNLPTSGSSQSGEKEEVPSCNARGSGLTVDYPDIVGSIAARTHKRSKSTESIEDELMDELYEDEGAGLQPANDQCELPRDEKRWMILSSICDCQNLAAMMDANPKLPAKRDFATTALHWGAKLGRKDLVQLMADFGLDVNSRTGQTALHLAAMQGHDDVIKILINDYGANIHARDYSGRKPKDLVKDTVNPDLQRKLGKQLILDPNIHLVCGVARSSKDEHFARIEADYCSDGNMTPETRRRVRTMSFLKKKKKWPPEKYDSEDDSEKHKHRPKSIVLLTPNMARKYKEQSRSMSSFEF